MAIQLTWNALHSHWLRAAACAAVASWLTCRVALGAEPGPGEGKRPLTVSLNVAAAVTNHERVKPSAYSHPQALPVEEPNSPAAKLVAMQPGRPPAPPEEIGAEEGRDVNAARIFRPITQVTANVALPPGLLPEQAARQPGQPPLDQMPLVEDARFFAGWGEAGFEWSATRLCHGPLYFEEANLERYGYQCNPLVQPLVSGAHFFLTIPTLPYQVVVHPPRECIYTLGYYRPGSRVPWRRNCPFPWDPRAAAFESAVAVGLVFAIP
jgi:hypothetical protein